MTASIHVFCEIENTLTDEITRTLDFYRCEYDKILHETIDAEAFEFDKKKLDEIAAKEKQSYEQLAQLCLTKIISELKIVTTVNGERI